MTFGSLFAGIGGMDLGLERAGMECRWQVEIDPFCQKVLEKHWLGVKRYGDIRGLDGSELERVDLIAGGFPCTDLSFAGKGAGIHAERSGLWWDMLRIICKLRPQYVLVENVSALLKRGMGEVLAGLASCGYDSEWDCLPASALGAYHDRDRTFIVAYPTGIDGHARNLLEAGRDWRSSFQSRRLYSVAVAQEGQQQNIRLECEPRLARLVSRLPNRTHRLEGLGNAVYPDVAEWIGKRIIESTVDK